MQHHHNSSRECGFFFRLLCTSVVLGSLSAGCDLLNGTGWVDVPGVNAGTDNSDQASAIVITSMKLEGVTSEPSDVEVGVVRDQDGASDTAWSTTFALDSGAESSSLPSDQGEDVSHSLKVRSVTSASGETKHKKILVKLYR